MISVGIDVSKEKTTVCIFKPYGEIVRKPFDIYHTQTDLLRLSAIIRDLDEEVRVVMEATGVYHLPILTFLKDECFCRNNKSFRNETISMSGNQNCKDR